MAGAPRAPIMAGMHLAFGLGGAAHASAIASVRNAAAEHLTRIYGTGPWSSMVTERGVLSGMRTGQVVIARERGQVVGTLRLQRKKPWAIDVSYFTRVTHPLYLLDMAIRPDHQRQGVGRQLLEAAGEQARAWPADVIRLDAYDDPAGAGPFYAKCGYRETGRVSYRGVPLIYFERLLTSER